MRTPGLKMAAVKIQHKNCLQSTLLQIIESLTSKIIEPLTEKTWAQGCVIPQRAKWPQVEFTSLSEENILNE